MQYRPHRSHIRYAPVAAPAMPTRRRSARPGAAVARIVPPLSRSTALTGIVYGLAPALLLWAGIFAVVHAVV